ncbi:M23 family metallopeptidase [Streptomyces sparsogenes]|uniref:Putative peptidase n=1 Tax=Streptomyces sparsogenes DSM 40356 TaxID=1331668 RepID=A0A1R1S572_9ACTN|nr:M23 family metallopeptidase [Streptomyces sparsogenes]OMI33373.1 putative peptidase [Streptomyces sparsogenes DSM 40356]
MNDRHPSGITTSTVPAPDASYPYYEAYDQQGTAHGYAGYDGCSTGTFDNLTAAYGDGDPLFGSLPGGQDGGYGAGGLDGSTGGQYDAPQWGAAAGPYDSGTYDTTAMWADSGVPAAGTIPAQQDSDTGGQWDATAWDTTGHHDLAAAQWSGTGQYDTSGVDTGQTQCWDMSAYATVDESQYEQHEQHTPYEQHAQHAPYEQYEQYEQHQTYGNYEKQEQGGYHEGGYEHGGYQQPAEQPYAVPEAESEPGAVAVHEAETQTALMVLDLDSPDADTGMPGTAGTGTADPHDAEGGATDDEDRAPAETASLPSPRSAASRRDGGRSRRRAPAARPKRSALLTVAVPSVCALGVTAVAAASVSNFGDDKKDTKTTQAAADTPPVNPSVANSKLDTQLAAGLEDADDFRDRASRTQERIDLHARQAAERKRKLAEAARKEALRPKFALPVSQHGLSAGFGQAGVNWMSLHTGIDFPVDNGTPVMAATDGTVRTQWNDAYGNMVILTSPDGTETWYCHLSTAKIRAGSVKAGDVIAYSGDSGNSTGPHLHFEVHPGGGAAINPLPWLRSHGLDPT